MPESSTSYMLRKAVERGDSKLKRMVDTNFDDPITVSKKDLNNLWIKNCYYQEMLLHVQSLLIRQLSSVNPLYDQDQVCVNPDSFDKALEILKGSKNERK